MFKSGFGHVIIGKRIIEDNIDNHAGNKYVIMNFNKFFACKFVKNNVRIIYLPFYYINEILMIECSDKKNR